MSVTNTGIIYQIYYINDKNINYIGSSMNNNIKKRWKYHVGDFNKYLKDSNNNRANIYPFFKEYGIENFKIIKLKEIDIIDDKHLKAYEQLFINKYKPVNKRKPFNILANVDRKNYLKQYYGKNIEKIKEKGRIRYLNDPEYFANYAKENKEKIKEYKHQLYLKEKEYTCNVCQFSMKEKSFIKHKRTQKHKKICEK